jgi:3D (Asp-Asp-Asp) domain-containing protein
MLNRTIVAAVLVLVTMAIGDSRKASAQEAGDAKAPAVERQAYRVDFSVNEMEDGKKINSRQYSMNVAAGDNQEIKIGTRVPIEEKAGEFSYLDVGTSLWCRLRDHSDVAWLGNTAVLLNVRSEVSNFAVPDQQGQNMRPLLRQLKIEASTVAQLGKPLVVGSVDDPNSKRQFQLEVTVAKLH